MYKTSEAAKSGRVEGPAEVEVEEQRARWRIANEGNLMRSIFEL